MKPAKSDSESAEFSSALEIALKQLAKRDRFASEIHQLLAAKGISATKTGEVIEHLIRKGLLNDRRTVEALMRRQSGKRAVGSERMRQLLTERGAPPELLDEMFASADEEPSHIESLLDAKFPHGADNAKAARFLYSRGFSESAIEAALEKWLADSA